MQNIKRELSIIIVNYRSEQYLYNCIASVFNFFKSINFEIIIVNNDKNPIAETQLAVFLEKSANIKIINHRKNIGFGAGINLGAKKAEGKYLLLLNPDIEIIEEGIEKILEKFEKNPQIAVIGPRLVAKNGETQKWCAGKEITVRSIVKNNFGIVESKKIWESEKEIGADWVSGGAMFIRADAFRETGGFDESFFMYAEDLDLCRRVRRSGFSVLYFPTLSILHIGGMSREHFLKQKIQFFKSTVYYLKKWAK